MSEQSLNEAMNDFYKRIQIEANGGLAVNVQDQTTRPVAIRLAKAVTGPYLLAETTVPNTKTIVLEDATGLTVGDAIGVFQDSVNPGFYFARINSISTNTLTLNIPIPLDFHPETATLFELNNNMAVDGSSTAQVFTLSNNSEVDVDITRSIIKIITDTEGDLDDFGDLATLTNGIVMRHAKADGTYENILTARNNSEIALHAYDYTTYDATNPSQGVYGSLTRFSFAGQEKLGVAIRLKKNERLEMVIQDNLSGLIDFKVMVQGHFTQD